MAKEKQTITAADVGELKIVSGVAIAVSSANKARSRLIQGAMAQAITDCIAEAAKTGAPFPSDDVLRAAQLAARDRMKAELDAVAGR